MHCSYAHLLLWSEIECRKDALCFVCSSKQHAETGFNKSKDPVIKRCLNSLRRKGKINRVGSSTVYITRTLPLAENVKTGHCLPLTQSNCWETWFTTVLILTQFDVSKNSRKRKMEDILVRVEMVRTSINFIALEYLLYCIKTFVKHLVHSLFRNFFGLKILW